MSDPVDRVLEVVPKQTRPTLKVILAILIVGGTAILLEHQADAHILRVTEPWRVRVEQSAAIIEHVFIDYEAERARAGLPTHDLAKIKEVAKRRAMAAQKEDAHEAE